MARGFRLALLATATLVSTSCNAQERRSESRDGERTIAAVEAAKPSSEQRSNASIGRVMSPSGLVISSDWGQLTAELVDNDATRALVEMLPARIEMRDHLRQEKTGALPSPLPQASRQTAFTAGTLGLWGSEDFVIYYRSGSVPQPGIVVLGQVTGDVSIFDRPGAVTVQVQRSE